MNPKAMRLVWTALTVGLVGSVAGLGAGAPAVSAEACRANPLRGNHGFLVLVERDATLGSGDVDGAMAVGGDLTLAGDYRAALGSAGAFVVAKEPRPTALFVGGRVNWSANATGGHLRVHNEGYVKVGDMTGSTVLTTDRNRARVNTRVVPAGAAYESARGIELTTRQPADSVRAAAPLDMTRLFAAYRQRADALARRAQTVTLQNANGVPLARPLAAGTQAYLRLQTNRLNVLNLTGAELANLGTVTFRDKPTADSPLLVNVAASGALSWQVTGFAGVGTGDARNVLVNIPGRVDLTMTGGDSLYATLFAPRTTLYDRSPANLDGAVIVRSLDNATGTRQSGEIHRAAFEAGIDCAQPTGGTYSSPAPGTSSAPVPGTSMSSAPVPGTSMSSAPAPAVSQTASAPAGADQASAPASAAPASSGSLPVTGVGWVIPLTLLGAGLVVGGVLLAVRVRRTP